MSISLTLALAVDTHNADEVSKISHPVCLRKHKPNFYAYQSMAGFDVS